MSDATFYGRLAIGGLLVAWMQWGPVAHQLFGQKVKPGMSTWRMYYGAARDVCDARYYAVDQAGNRTLVNRFEALGYDHFYDARKAVRRIANRSHVERQGRQLCREFLPAGQHLEVDARCGSYKGWKRETFDGPLCRGSFDPTRKRSKDKQKGKAPQGGKQ